MTFMGKNNRSLFQRPRLLPKPFLLKALSLTMPITFSINASPRN
jgi:hypothetical protein